MKFQNLADFAQRFPAAASAALRDVVARAHGATHSEVLAQAQQLTPQLTGYTAGQWKSEPNPPETAIRALKPTAIVNRAPVINILNRGLRAAKAYKVRRSGKTFIVPAGRRLGSARARRGIKKPVLRALAQRDEAIVAEAVAGSAALGELLR